MAVTDEASVHGRVQRKAVASWETNGRMQTEVTAELEIMPTMRRRWRRELQECT